MKKYWCRQTLKCRVIVREKMEREKRRNLTKLEMTHPES